MLRLLFISSFLLLLGQSKLFGQIDTARVLFLGNSYTAGNNLPLLVSQLSMGANKVLIYDSNTPGGYTFDLHSRNTTSLSKIRQSNWDYVVLQEQSQIPTIPFYRDSLMLPAAQRLKDSIHAYNPCAKIVMYMTWGRRFGGRQCDQGQTNCSPNFVDFNHMQDSLATAYKRTADSINALIAPVGISWKRVLNDTNIVLHTADNSHPNYSGSFLAACTFYRLIWNESPDSSTFIGSLSSSMAAYLKGKADSTVFLTPNQWNLNLYQIQSNFSFQINQDTVHFLNQSIAPAGASFQWVFGDGNNSMGENPIHVYTNNQAYTVDLLVTYCGESDTLSQQLIINSLTQTIEDELGLRLYPNPIKDQLNIEFQTKHNLEEAILYQLNGAEYMRLSIKGDQTPRFDLSELANGIYILKLFDNGHQARWEGKFLKQ